MTCLTPLTLILTFDHKRVTFHRLHNQIWSWRKLFRIYLSASNTWTGRLAQIPSWWTALRSTATTGVASSARDVILFRYRDSQLCQPFNREHEEHEADFDLSTADANAKSHVGLHTKLDCGPGSRKASGQPTWWRRSRQPAFVSPIPLQSFGRLKYLWGDTPSYDVLNMAMNEGGGYNQDLALCLAGKSTTPHALIPAATDPKRLVTFAMSWFQSSPCRRPLTGPVSAFSTIKTQWSSAAPLLCFSF